MKNAASVGELIKHDLIEYQENIWFYRKNLFSIEKIAIDLVTLRKQISLSKTDEIFAMKNRLARVRWRTAYLFYLLYVLMFASWLNAYTRCSWCYASLFSETFATQPLKTFSQHNITRHIRSTANATQLAQHSTKQRNILRVTLHQRCNTTRNSLIWMWGELSAQLSNRFCLVFPYQN